MNYTLRQLRTFVAVARHGSFSQTGQVIGLSQLAVSHSIKELESEMAVRLLDRTMREVMLTEARQQLALKVDMVQEDWSSGNALSDGRCRYWHQHSTLAAAAHLDAS